MDVAQRAVDGFVQPLSAPRRHAPADLLTGGFTDHVLKPKVGTALDLFEPQAQVVCVRGS